MKGQMSFEGSDVQGLVFKLGSAFLVAGDAFKRGATIRVEGVAEVVAVSFETEKKTGALLRVHTLKAEPGDITAVEVVTDQALEGLS